MNHGPIISADTDSRPKQRRVAAQITLGALAIVFGLYLAPIAVLALCVNLGWHA